MGKIPAHKADLRSCYSVCDVSEHYREKWLCARPPQIFSATVRGPDALRHNAISTPRQPHSGTLNVPLPQIRFGKSKTEKKSRVSHSRIRNLNVLLRDPAFGIAKSAFYPMCSGSDRLLFTFPRFERIPRKRCFFGQIHLRALAESSSTTVLVLLLTYIR